MNDKLELAAATLLEPVNLSLSELEKPLAVLADNPADLGEIYIQKIEHESFALEESKVKNASFSIDQGVGIRAVSADKTGFAYSDSIDLNSMLDSARAAGSILKTGKTYRKKIPGLKESKELYTAANPLASIDSEDKIDLLQKLDAKARQQDPRISEVFTNLSASHETVLVLASDGTLAADVRPMVRLSVTVIANTKSKKEQGSASIGGRYTLQDLLGRNPEALAAEAVRQALANLEAKPAPAGAMDVLLGPGWPGVLLHEAVGHGLEADFNRKQTSVFTNAMGDKVTSELCTIVDDGTLPGRRGSLEVDDEGNATTRTVLIENGILKNYMQDKQNANLMQAGYTGNGRRESYAYLPMPRMTNTFMLPGTATQEEMLAKIKRGIFAVNFSGGQVDITSGNFVFSTSECYYVENGKIQYPVKDATLIGSGLEVMQRVQMVGDDLELDPGIGVCGKNGQSVPVGVGQPSILVKDLVVGGTKT